MNGIDAILDTNAIIYLQKSILATPLPKGCYAVSVITEIELFSAPNLAPLEIMHLKQLFSALFVIDIDSIIKQKSIEPRKTYNLKIPDAIIVTTAIVYNIPLITNDKQLHGVKEFSYQEISLCPNSK
jgi:predicted nucleic acid-binding protein